MKRLILVGLIGIMLALMTAQCGGAAALFNAPMSKFGFNWLKWQQ